MSCSQALGEQPPPPGAPLSYSSGMRWLRVGDRGWAGWWDLLRQGSEACVGVRRGEEVGTLELPGCSVAHSCRRRLLETAATGHPHCHRSGPGLFEGHQESDHSAAYEEGWPCGLHPAAAGRAGQEGAPWATALRARAQPRAPRGTQAALGQRQALVVVIFCVPEPPQAALAAEVLGRRRWHPLPGGCPGLSGPIKMFAGTFC